MKLTIHRGAEEIGGNCIELVSGKSRILLDYGTPLPKIDASGRMQQIDPKKAILNIEGLYSDCETPISGLIISHTHQDHYGMLFEKPINPNVPVYMSEIMEDIIRITGKMGPDHKELKAHVLPFVKEHTFAVGSDFKITPYLMDHSASESFAFLIQAEGRKVIYTGDYREHGHKKNAFKKFLDTNLGEIDVLITDGTMADVEKGKTEKIIMGEIAELIKEKNGTVYVMCAGQNVDLLSSLGGIAAKTNRYLVVDGYVALILERLKELALKAGVHLKIPGLENKYLKVVNNYVMNNLRKQREYADTIRRIERNMVSWDWITTHLDRLIFPVRTYSQKWLGQHIKRFDKAVFIYSMWEGYQEGIEFQRTIEYFMNRGMEPHRIHVSGHAYMSTIRKLIRNKKPRCIIPVHTVHPEIFQKEFGEKVHVMKNGETWEI